MSAPACFLCLRCDILWLLRPELCPFFGREPFLVVAARQKRRRVGFIKCAVSLFPSLSLVHCRRPHDVASQAVSPLSTPVFSVGTPVFSVTASDVPVSVSLVWFLFHAFPSRRFLCHTSVARLLGCHCFFVSKAAFNRGAHADVVSKLCGSVVASDALCV